MLKFIQLEIWFTEVGVARYGLQYKSSVRCSSARGRKRSVGVGGPELPVGLESGAAESTVDGPPVLRTSANLATSVKANGPPSVN